MALAEKGSRVRAGDFAEPDSLWASFAVAEQVLVVSVDRLGGRGAGCIARRHRPPTRPLSLAGLAAVASELTGREVRRVVVSDVAWREAEVAKGGPIADGGRLARRVGCRAAGDFAATDPTLQTLLGRPPQRAATRGVAAGPRDGGGSYQLV